MISEFPDVSPLIQFILLCCVSLIGFGIGKLVVRCIETKGERSRRAAREAAFVVQARAELAATGWTPRCEALYQAEIAATKRGDLLAAAHYAEQRETAHV